MLWWLKEREATVDVGKLSVRDALPEERAEEREE